MRYRIDLAYHGRDFCGWQFQPGLRTVQGEMEMWLTRLLRADPPVKVTGAGRTDSGVHAAGMVAHFDCGIAVDAGQLLHQLRPALPPDLVVTSMIPVPDSFHARYSAVSRTYSYRVAVERTPFGNDRQWTLYDRLDFGLLCEAATVILGDHDFSGFCVAESRKDNNRCRVSVSSWRRCDPVWVYHIRADRFLHEMVRLLVGTFVDVGRGRISVSRIREILETSDVRLCGDAAPPHGLTLEKVEYPSS